jgi:hypothetical protein
MPVPCSISPSIKLSSKTKILLLSIPTKSAASIPVLRESLLVINMLAPESLSWNASSRTVNVGLAPVKIPPAAMIPK